MKVGDLIQYRDRIYTDPPPPGSWGRHGIIIDFSEDIFGENYAEPAIIYLTDAGHFVIARQDDVRVISESR